MRRQRAACRSNVQALEIAAIADAVAHHTALATLHANLPAPQSHKQQKYTTEVQRRAAPVVLSGSDAVVQSQTGSGKTAAFLLPALSRLAYAPERYPEDMRGPQLLVLVPTFELGTQVRVGCACGVCVWGGVLDVDV